MKKFALYFVLVVFSGFNLISIHAHEEPPKTIKEKKEKTKESARIKKLGIKNSIAWKFVVTDGTITEKKYKYLETEYSRDGLMLSITAYDTSGSVSEQVRYRYDDLQNMILDADFNPEGKEVERIEYSFDEQGRVKSSVNFKNGEKDSRFVYIMNNDSKAVEFYKYLPDEELEYRIDYKYTSDPDIGNLDKIYKFNPGKDTLMSVKYTYFENEKVKEKHIFGQDGQLMHTFLYQYDNNGYRKEIQKILPGEVSDFIQKFIYDNDGNCLEIQVFKPDGTVTSKIVYEYLLY